jgi:NAD(P)H dehydrogenase (quinone)
MTKILVVYHSSYGHVQAMAHAVANGANSVEGAQATVKCVPEHLPRDVMENAGMKLDLSDPVAEPIELAEYDAIIFGTPTRFGNMSGQMRNFLDQTGPLWMQGKLVGKIGSVFCSTGTQHGGQETTLTSFHVSLLHHGMIIVGLPYEAREQMTMDEISGGSPYGATCISGSGPSMRMPIQRELDLCRFQGAHVAKISARLLQRA